jgi:hypothetical protein
MTWRYAFFFLLIAFIVVNCSKTKELTVDRSRTMQPSEITSFHPEMNIRIGWVPYQDQKLVRTGDNEWKIVHHVEGDGTGSIPTLLVSYPETEDTLFLNMNIENELLGKLIKHSAMTQEPIRRPFTNFFEEAKCQKCHPPHIKIDLE